MATAWGPPAYRVEGVTKVYPRGKVLANDDVTFSIPQGEIFGLLGPNGAGKSTLVRQLAGLVAPTSGCIELMGHRVSGNAEIIPYLVAYMTQRPMALGDLTIEEALAVTGHLRGMSRRDARAAGRALIDEFNLGGIARRVIGKLSGGEQRLTAFCMVLTGGRPILILDEPTNDLDPGHRKQLWDRLVSLNNEQGTTIILVTHNVMEAEKVLRRVGIINCGRILAMGTASELKAQVDTRMRLEITFRQGVDEETQRRLVDASGLPAPVATGRGRYAVWVDAGLADQEIGRVISRIGFGAVEDLRVQAPTLEDVYIRL
ncbi:MAG TPA: ABC transporter ATP-binding protein, partial [Clostridiales bacterium UBA8153]|nr:ABC transporter ATP-binding protein [Clostridiales bacterium UBA8153]